MADLDPCPTARGGFKWGRLVSLAGALGLCVSFFMPHIPFFFGPIIPVKSTVDSDGLFLGAFGLPFLAAILLAPLLAFRSVPRVNDAPGVGRFLAWADCAICLAVVTIGLGWLTYAVFIRGLSYASQLLLTYAVTATVIASLALAIVALVRSRLPRKAAAAQFALGASCLAYFAFFAIEGTVYAGLWLSLAASGVLALGSAIDWFQCRPAPEKRRLPNGPETGPCGRKG